MLGQAHKLCGFFHLPGDLRTGGRSLHRLSYLGSSLLLIFPTALSGSSVEVPPCQAIGSKFTRISEVLKTGVAEQIPLCSVHRVRFSFSRVTERVPPIFRSIEDNGSSAAISMKAGGSFRDAPCDPVAVAQPSITVPSCLDNGVCSYRDCSPKFASSCVPRHGVHPDGMGSSVVSPVTP